MRALQWRWVVGLVSVLLLAGMAGPVRAGFFTYDVTIDTSGLTGFNGPGAIAGQVIDFQYNLNGSPSAGGNTMTATVSVLQGVSSLGGVLTSAGVSPSADLTAGPVTMQVDTSAGPATVPELTQYVTFGSTLEFQVTLDTGPTNLLPLTGTELLLTLFDANGNVLLDNGTGVTVEMDAFSDGTTLSNPLAFPAGAPVPPGTNPIVQGPLAVATPEPSTVVLLGIGAGALCGIGYRRRGRRLQEVSAVR